MVSVSEGHAMLLQRVRMSEPVYVLGCTAYKYTRTQPLDVVDGRWIADVGCTQVHRLVLTTGCRMTLIAGEDRLSRQMVMHAPKALQAKAWLSVQRKLSTSFDRQPRM